MPSPIASIVFWAAVLCCVVAEVAIVRSTALARGMGPGPAGDDARLPSVRRGTEVAWAVLPALALAAVLAWTWREMHRGDGPAALRAPSQPAAADAPAVP